MGIREKASYEKLKGLLESNISGYKELLDSTRLNKLYEETRERITEEVINENTPITKEQVLYETSEKRKEEMRQGIRSKLTTYTEEKIEETINSIESLGEEIKKGGSTKAEKLAYKWVLGGRLILPEDHDKFIQAFKVSEKAKVDPFRYSSPMELIEAHSDIELKAKPIDPDTVLTLTNKVDYGNGVVVYDVEDSEESRKNMREIINTHLGKDRSPWCLLQGDGKGNLTEYSKRYWEHYNKYPKRVAFVDGKLSSFFASNRGPTWWNTQDKPHKGITKVMKMPGDKLGRTATYELNEETRTFENPTDIFKKTKTEESYWYDNGQLQAEFLFNEQGKEVVSRREWYDNGQPKTEALYNEQGKEVSYREWYENGVLKYERLYTGTGLCKSMKLWYENGQLKEEIINLGLGVYKKYDLGDPDAPHQTLYETRETARELEPLTRGESATIHNKILGDIEYPIGKTGKHGYGLLHIVEQRMKKDGKSLDEAVDIAVKVGESAKYGEVVKEIRNTKHIERDGVKAIVASHENGKTVITGFEVNKSSEGEMLGTDLQPNHYTQKQGAVLEDVVASLEFKIQNILDNVKGETRENVKNLTDLSENEAQRIVSEAKKRGYIVPRRVGEIAGDVETMTQYAELDRYELLGASLQDKAQAVIDSIDLTEQQEERNLYDVAYEKWMAEYTDDNGNISISEDTKKLMALKFISC